MGGLKKKKKESGVGKLTSNNVSQIKVKLCLSMQQRHTAAAELQLHSFLTSALDRGERLTLCSARFTPGK